MYNLNGREDESTVNLSVRVFPRTFGYQGEMRYEFSQADDLVGVVSVCEDETSYFIHFLNVMPGNRGKGYGSKILKMLCQMLHDKPITLELDKGSPFGIENLRAWYSRHGFVSTTEDLMIRQPSISRIQEA
ncbi:GNAT family N-acetyltransferase [Coleofasciculus sp. E2-BRE-01]|uniref:GNAT family N-acetyltransferase n=1 Tax=Coleofasciculus sp. E2-BRE-01 TaxID=3069524 RepID=UPI003301099F